MILKEYWFQVVYLSLVIFCGSALGHPGHVHHEEEGEGGFQYEHQLVLASHGDVQGEAKSYSLGGGGGHEEYDHHVDYYVSTHTYSSN